MVMGSRAPTYGNASIALADSRSGLVRQTRGGGKRRGEVNGGALLGS
jgi:hypothetical protein